MEMNSCFSNRRSKERDQIQFSHLFCTDADLLTSLKFYLCIMSVWISLEPDPRRYFHVILQPGAFCTLTHATWQQGPFMLGYPRTHNANTAPLLPLPFFSKTWVVCTCLRALPASSLRCLTLVVFTASTLICKVSWKHPRASNLSLGGRGKVWAGLVWLQPFNLSIITSWVEVIRNVILNFLAHKKGSGLSFHSFLWLAKENLMSLGAYFPESFFFSTHTHVVIRNVTQTNTVLSRI